MPQQQKSYNLECFSKAADQATLSAVAGAHGLAVVGYEEPGKLQVQANNDAAEAFAAAHQAYFLSPR